MPIYELKGDRVKKVQSKNFTGQDKEKKLQRLIEKNLIEIFEMEFIATEFSTNHGGRIDTLALDSNQRPVIIEYKADKSSTVLLQGLYYMDWLVDNKAEYEKLVRTKLKKDISVNWNNGVRLLLIAKSFEIWDKFAVNRIKEEVELYEYTFYENNELKLEKASLPKDFKGKVKTSITSAVGYSVETLMNKIKDNRIKNIVNELREEVKLISDDIEEHATKYHIVFKSTVNIAAIYIQPKQYWVDVKLPKNYVIKKFKDLNVRNHKDKVFSHITCNEKTNIKHLLVLIEEAFEKTK